MTRSVIKKKKKKVTPKKHLIDSIQFSMGYTG